MQNMYSEGSGGCHSYWFASAFTGSAWHYQYSVPFAAHGADVSAYWGPPADNQSPEFVEAFRSTSSWLGTFSTCYLLQVSTYKYYLHVH